MRFQPLFLGSAVLTLTLAAHADQLPDTALPVDQAATAPASSERVALPGFTAPEGGALFTEPAKVEAALGSVGGGFVSNTKAPPGPPVPEPSTFLLLATGAAGLAGAARRRYLRY